LFLLDALVDDLFEENRVRRILNEAIIDAGVDARLILGEHRPFAIENPPARGLAERFIAIAGGSFLAPLFALDDLKLERARQKYQHEHQQDRKEDFQPALEQQKPPCFASVSSPGGRGEITLELCAFE